MKKAITIFLSIAIIGLVSSQIVTKEKAKTVVQKDSIKKDKATLQPEIVFNDSMIVVKGVFKPFKNNVVASYYADKFNGRRTASGKKFDNTKYTAAHRKLPFGTKLKITNEANGKSIIVEVTDRGPFSRGREIDLTKKAFMEIASNKSSGAFKVKIEMVN
ncbi:septal ring lytic transglycosylase RlpA family protein [Flavobacterium luteum]|uniref:Probable endolytic peptidoglycan transglycosylase RlpA n=1 Tax=Flavobacterium luteum TaxID=2026654 RepID=A0A7J5AEL5_9FLAO|nr:septal ring lytic transglycosylase RlpA family protein [Flavobacterium luteum]KAB1156037.1 septal ring lytic transglycosylase RlpA family protein [Flavobacterium luteum]